MRSAGPHLIHGRCRRRHPPELPAGETGGVEWLLAVTKVAQARMSPARGGPSIGQTNT